MGYFGAENSAQTGISMIQTGLRPSQTGIRGDQTRLMAGIAEKLSKSPHGNLVIRSS